MIKMYDNYHDTNDDYHDTKYHDDYHDTKYHDDHHDTLIEYHEKNFSILW